MNDQRKTKIELVQEIQSLREAMKLQMDHALVTSMQTDFIASANDVILLIDEAQNIVQFNSAAESVFGYPACEVLGKPVHILLPSQSQKWHTEAIRNLSRTGSTARNSHSLGILTGLRANGETFPLEISITQVTQDSKSFNFAILHDVSKWVKMEELLLRQYGSLNSLHQITLALLCQHDIKELLQFIVDEAAKLLDSPYCEILLPENGELVAKAFTKGTPFPSGNRFTRNAAPLSWKVFDSGLPATVSSYSQWESHNKAFDSHHFHAAASIPILVGETCIGVLGFARVKKGHGFTDEDILSASRFAAISALAMENSRLYREIEMLATTDELTATRNRRSIMEIGEREVKRSIRYARPLSLLMIDADHFKLINDTWGHPTGDMVLRGLAQQCMDQIRVTDTVGRYGQGHQEVEGVIGRLGGEEFVILLAETRLEQARIVAERIRWAIERMDFHSPPDWQARPSIIQVTVSIGVASLHLEKDSLLELLTRADKALYKAKAAGRNRVCVQD
jgi:PAS domain S-box-containing protein